MCLLVRERQKRKSLEERLKKAEKEIARRGVIIGKLNIKLHALGQDTERVNKTWIKRKQYDLSERH